MGRAGSDRNIQQAEFLRKRLFTLQKNDRKLSVRMERLRKRMESSLWEKVGAIQLFRVQVPAINEIHAGFSFFSKVLDNTLPEM